MGESGAQASMSRLSADPPSTAAKTERAPRSPGTRLLLSRLPVTILAAAYVIVFLIKQVPEFAGVHALAQVARQASVLVWASLPGTGGVGAVDANGVFVLLAIVGSIVLAFVGTRPAVGAAAVPARVRGRLPWLAFTWLAVPAAALVVLGLLTRVIVVLGQPSWSPVPVGGLAFGLLGVVTAIFALREIVLASPDGQSSAADEEEDGGWRGKRWFFLIAITWIGDVAIGRYFEPKLIAVIAAVAPAKRWDYLGNSSSWWLYLLGLLVVLIGYGLLQLLPPWNGRARQLVVAAVLVIAAFVAFQQVHPYAHTAVTRVIQHPPSGA
jgi:hypothetical protein